MIQNTSVALCATTVCLILIFETTIDGIWNGYLYIIAIAGIITLAVIAELASVGYKVAIEKDWIVVVAQGNKSVLASKLFKNTAFDCCLFVLYL